MEPPRPLADETPPETLPFQFGLRTLLAVVASVCALLAAIDFLGAVWSAILVWLLLLVGVHVGANAWGTRRARQQGLELQPDSELPACAEQPIAYAPLTRLRDDVRLSWITIVCTSAGAITFGTLGATGLALSSWSKSGYAGIAVGGVSAAILGGFLGFLLSSFAEVGSRAWREAVAGDKRTRR